MIIEGRYRTIVDRPPTEEEMEESIKNMPKEQVDKIRKEAREFAKQQGWNLNNKNNN